MIRRLVVWAALAILAGGVVSAEVVDTEPARGIRAADPDHVAFTHATVVVSPERTVEDATLVIRDGRVVSVEAGAAAPDGARVVDLDGLTVFPGFIDPYTGYGLPPPPPAAPQGRDRPPQYEADRTGAVSWNAAVHPEFRAVSRFAPDEKSAEAFWKRGVTTVQTLRRDGIFRGRAAVVTLARGEPNAAVLIADGPQALSFDKGSSSQEYPGSQMGAIALIRQTLLDANWYARALAAWRGEPGQDRPAVDRGLAALAGYTGPFLVEAPDELALLRAVRVGHELDRRLVFVGSGREYRRVDAIAAADPQIILPLSFPKTPEVESYEDALDVELAALRHWERAPTNPGVLAEHGVEFAFTAHGLRDEEELLANVRRAIESGLPRRQALAALTTVPAGLLGIGGTAGTLEPGRRADLVISEGDLLTEKKAQVLAVWIGGEPTYESIDLDTTDFRGRWGFQLREASWELLLSGSRAEPQGSLRGPDGEESELRAVEPHHDQLRFRASVGEPGVARFTLVRLGADDRLVVTLPDGSRVTTTLQALPPEPEEEEQRTEEPEAQEQFVSRLTQPLTAFGFESLPVPETVLFRDATLWTNEEAGVVEGGDLLIRNGRIAAIGDDLPAPEGVRVIDARGRHLTPGLIDEHSHIAISGAVNEASQASTAEVRIGDVVDPDDVAIYRALAGGTTTVQLLHGSANPIGGQAQVVKLRWGRGPERMKLDAATPSIKFALGENVKQSNWGDLYTIRYPQTRMGVQSFFRDRFLAAREYEREWQAWRTLGERERARTVPPRRDLELETLLEILHGERLVHCHSYVQSEILALMRLAEEFGFRIGTFTHILEGYKVAPEMAAHGAAASTFSDWWAYKFEVYDAIPGNACLLQRAGVVTSVNSDSSDLIRRLNTEAAKSVMHCGMSEQEALELVTLNPAIQLGIDDRVGSLATGKDADLVLWSGHPLSMHSRVEQTWVDGALYFSRQRDEELRTADDTERRALVQKILQLDAEEEKEKEPEGEARDADPQG